MKRVVVLFFLAAAGLAAQSGPFDARAHEIFKQLIEINTTDSVGNVTTAADVVAERLKAAGFPASDVQVLGPDPRKHNVVARYRGTGARRPLLLLAHLDVVEAKREDWSVDPFTFLEKAGFFYGRGTSEDNAIYHVSKGLERLAAFDFPVHMNEVTRAYFERMAAFQTDPTVAAAMRAVARPTPDPQAVSRLADASPYYNALMRTTCVPTM